MDTYEIERIKRADWLELAFELFGRDLTDWTFVCPRCGQFQTARDMLRIGLQEDQIEENIGINCIGNFNPYNTGCFLKLSKNSREHELEIIMEDGRKQPIFKFLKPAT